MNSFDLTRPRRGGHRREYRPRSRHRRSAGGGRRGYRARSAAAIRPKPSPRSRRWVVAAHWVKADLGAKPDYSAHRRRGRRQTRRPAHPREQRRHHPPQQRHRLHRGRLGRGARRQSQVGVLPVAGRGAPHDSRGRRQDHQHRLDAVVPGRHSRAFLHRQQERHRRAHETARQRVGGERHQRQCHRARILRHQQHGGVAGRREAQRGNSRAHSRRTLGRSAKIWAAPRFSSPRAPRTTCRASFSRSTAAGWRADRSYHPALVPEPG